jgi:hypothetical protein
MWWCLSRVWRGWFRLSQLCKHSYGKHSLRLVSINGLQHISRSEQKEYTVDNIKSLLLCVYVCIHLKPETYCTQKPVSRRAFVYSTSLPCLTFKSSAVSTSRSPASIHPRPKMPLGITTLLCLLVHYSPHTTTLITRSTISFTLFSFRSCSRDFKSINWECIRFRKG